MWDSISAYLDTLNAMQICFLCAMIGGGLKVAFDEQKGVTILQEGKFRKLVKSVQQISYNGKLALERGQRMWYVTERCVFELTAEGIKLVEVARGIDVEKDILAQMDFRPIIAETLRETDTRVYHDGVFGLRGVIEGAR